MKKETKEIVALTEKYLGKVQSITTKYSKAISELDKVRVELEQTRSRYQKSNFAKLKELIPSILKIIFIISTFGFFAYFGTNIKCNTRYEFFNAKITRSCD